MWEADLRRVEVFEELWKRQAWMSTSLDKDHLVRLFLEEILNLPQLARGEFEESNAWGMVQVKRALMVMQTTPQWRRKFWERVKAEIFPGYYSDDDISWLSTTDEDGVGIIDMFEVFERVEIFVQQYQVLPDITDVPPFPFYQHSNLPMSLMSIARQAK